MANDDNVEPSAIPNTPSAVHNPVSVNVEPTSIPVSPAAPLESVVQESFDPPAAHMTVDVNLNSHIEASEKGTTEK